MPLKRLLHRRLLGRRVATGQHGAQRARAGRQHGAVHRQLAAVDAQGQVCSGSQLNRGVRQVGEQGLAGLLGLGLCHRPAHGREG